MRRRPAYSIAAIVAAGALACPAAALAGPARIGETGGLGLFGPDTPEVLEQARADPYAAPTELTCESAAAELAALDEALGPDADEPEEKANRVGKYVTKAIRGLIPHRDILRFLTGAGRKEDALQKAAMAGWARRGFLRGVSHQMGCAEGGSQLASRADDPPTPVAVAVDVAAVPTVDTAPSAPMIEPAAAPVRLTTISTAAPVRLTTISTAVSGPLTLPPTDVAVNP